MWHMDNSSDGGGTSDGFMAGELLAEERGIAKSRAVERLGSYDILLQQRSANTPTTARKCQKCFLLSYLHHRGSSLARGLRRWFFTVVRRPTSTGLSVYWCTHGRWPCAFGEAPSPSPTTVQPRRRVTSPTVFRSDDFCSFPPGSPLAR